LRLGAAIGDPTLLEGADDLREKMTLLLPGPLTTDIRELMHQLSH
jgi:hypothetical protein